MKIGTTDITKAYIGTTEVQKIYKGTTQIYPAGGGYYNVGTPSFVMRFDGSFADGGLTKYTAS